MTTSDPIEFVRTSAYVGRLGSARRHVPSGLRTTIAWRRHLILGLTLTDAAIVVLALALATFATRSVPVAVGVAETVGLGAVWLLALGLSRSRDIRILGIGAAEYRRVIAATLVAFGGYAAIALVLELPGARPNLLVALPVGLALSLLARYLWRSWMSARRREGRLLTGALVVGPARDVRRVTELFDRNRSAGYRAMGVAITADAAENPERLGDVESFLLEDLVRTVESSGVTAVVVAGTLPGGPKQLRELGWRLENFGVELVLVSRLTDVAGPRLYIRPVDGLPMVHVDLPQYAGTQHAVKRAMDIALASAALAVFALPMAITALLVKLDSPGPVIFRQQRVGTHGRPFDMLKFRSMVIDAESRKQALMDANEGNGVLFKMKSDPRITRVGRLIRRFSIDELPQLINVIRGEMSVVGPRPPLASEVEQYEESVARRLLIKPGLTGLWQVSGRSRLSWEESVRLDLFYVENWSVIGDILIMLRTIRAVLGRDGAY